MSRPPSLDPKSHPTSGPDRTHLARSWKDEKNHASRHQRTLREDGHRKLPGKQSRLVIRNSAPKSAPNGTITGTQRSAQCKRNRDSKLDCKTSITPICSQCFLPCPTLIHHSCSPLRTSSHQAIRLLSCPLSLPLSSLVVSLASPSWR